MQKKILFSLLMTAPVGLSAYANVSMPDFSEGQWKAGGASEDYKFQGPAVTAMLGNGYVEQTQTLPQGIYAIRFTGGDNVAVKVEGAKMLTAAPDEACRFEMKAGGDVKVTIESENKGTGTGFKFDNCELVLIYNFKAEGDRLGNLLYETLPGGLNSKDLSEFKPGVESEAADKAFAELTKEYNGIKDEIEAIHDGDDTTGEIRNHVVDLYKVDQLYKDVDAKNMNSLLSQRIKALKNLVKEYNTEVDKANNIATNDADKKDLLGQITGENGLQSTLDKLIKDIKAQDEEKGYIDLSGCLDRTSGAQKAIDKLKSDIEKAYENPAVDPADIKSKLETEVGKVADIISGIAGDFDADKADFAAHNKYLSLLADLDKAYNDAKLQVAGFQGVDGLESVYVDNKMQAWILALDNIYNDAKSFDYGMGENMAATDSEKIDEATEQLNGFINSIKVTVAADKAIVDAQNKAMTAARDEAANLTSSLKEITDKIVTVPAIFEKEYNEKVAGIKSDIEKFLNGSESDYKQQELDLTSDAKQAEIKAIEDKITELGKYVEKFAPINELMNTLKEAKEKVEKMDKIPGTEFTYASKFGINGGEEPWYNFAPGTFANVMNSIKAIEPEPDGTIDQTVKDNINAAIADILSTAELMGTVYQGIYDSLTANQTAVTDLTKYAAGELMDGTVGNKIVVPESDRDAVKKLMSDNEEFKSLDASLKANTAARNAAVAQTNAQEFLDAGKELWANMQAFGQTKDQIDANAAALKLEFSKTVTIDTNLANTEKALEALKAEALGTAEKPETYAGKDVVEKLFSQLNDELQQISEMSSEATDVAAYEAVDLKLQNLYIKIQRLSDNAKVLKENQTKYNAIKALFPGVSDKIGAVKEYNEDNSVENGLAYFENIIGTPKDAQSTAGDATLYARLAQIMADLEKTYREDNINAEGNPVAIDKVAFEEKLEALDTLADKVKGNIKDNNENHTAQLTEWTNVVDVYNAVMADLEEKQGAFGDADLPDNSEIKASIEALKNLYSNTSDADRDLTQTMTDIINAYGNGESLAMNGDIMADLKWIKDEILKIGADIDGEYANLIDAANKYMFESNDWDATYADLQKLFNSCIRRYNTFYYDLTNPGYRKAMRDEIDRHGDYFGNDAQIRELAEKKTQFLAQLKAEKKLLTQEEYDQWVAENVTVISDDMKGNLIELEKTANGVADDYWTVHEPEAAAALVVAKQKLAQAGIEDYCIRAAQAAYDEALARYDEAQTQLTFWTENGFINSKLLSDLPGLAMDEIANLLDKVPASIDLQKGAMDAWNQAYDNAQTTIDEYRQRIEDCDLADNKEAQLKIFNEKVAEIEALNSSVKNITEGLIDVYKPNKDELDSLMSDLLDCVTNVEQANANATDKIEALENFDKSVAAINKSLADLDSYADGFSQEYTIASKLNAIRSSLDELINRVDANKGDILTIKSEIDRDLADLTKLVLSAQRQLVFNEYNYADKQLRNNADVSFNNARVYDIEHNGSANKEALDAIYDDITAVKVKLSAVNTHFNFYEEADFKKFKADVLGYEKELCGIIQTLDEKYNGEQEDINPAANALQRLDTRYDEVSAAITAGQQTLDGCMNSVKEMFDGKYEELASQLGALKDGWNAAGTAVIGWEADYMAKVADIENEVSELTAQVAEEEQKAQDEAARKAANEAAYATMSEQLDKVRADFQEAKDLIAEYGFSERLYGFSIGNINNWINNTQRDIDNRYENVALGGLTLDTRSVDNMIRNLKTQVAGDEAEKQLDLAEEVLNNAEEALRKNIVPETKAELEKTFTELQNTFNAVRNSVPGADFEDRLKIIDVAKEIAEGAAQIVEQADENSFIPGDVNLDPDGVVNTVDVQMIVNWIGEGMTFSELYAQSPRQACAADLNDDQNLNVADVTMAINLALGQEPSYVRAMRRMAPVAGANTWTLQLLGEEGGVKHYALHISSSAALVAGQLDLTVSGGASIVDVNTAERSGQHELFRFGAEFGGMRLILASMENAEFAGDGAMILIDVEGHGTLGVENALFADRNAVTYRIEKSGSSFIDSVIEGANDVKERIYNVGGQMLNKFQRGINIIRKGNGKATKELHK